MSLRLIVSMTNRARKWDLVERSKTIGGDFGIESLPRAVRSCCYFLFLFEQKGLKMGTFSCPFTLLGFFGM